MATGVAYIPYTRHKTKAGAPRLSAGAIAAAARDCKRRKVNNTPTALPTTASVGVTARPVRPHSPAPPIGLAPVPVTGIACTRETGRATSKRPLSPSTPCQSSVTSLPAGRQPMTTQPICRIPPVSSSSRAILDDTSRVGQALRHSPPRPQVTIASPMLMKDGENPDASFSLSLGHSDIAVPVSTAHEPLDRPAPAQSLNSPPATDASRVPMHPIVAIPYTRRTLPSNRGRVVLNRNPLYTVDANLHPHAKRPELRDGSHLSQLAPTTPMPEHDPTERLT